MAKYGPKTKVGVELIDTRLHLWVTKSFREQMEREAEAAGYGSVSNYVREVKLGCLPRTLEVTAPTSA